MKIKRKRMEKKRMERKRMERKMMVIRRRKVLRLLKRRNLIM